MIKTAMIHGSSPLELHQRLFCFTFTGTLALHMAFTRICAPSLPPSPKFCSHIAVPLSPPTFKCLAKPSYLKDLFFTVITFSASSTVVQTSGKYFSWTVCLFNQWIYHYYHSNHCHKFLWARYLEIRIEGKVQSRNNWRGWCCLY